MQIPNGVVLIDTCIWASFFAKPDSVQKREVDFLIDEDRAGLIGPIVSENLRGIHRKDQAALLSRIIPTLLLGTKPHRGTERIEALFIVVKPGRSGDRFRGEVAVSVESWQA